MIKFYHWIMYVCSTCHLLHQKDHYIPPPMPPSSRSSKNSMIRISYFVLKFKLKLKFVRKQDLPPAKKSAIYYSTGRDNLSKCYRHQYNAMNFGTQLTFGPCNVNLYMFGSVQFYVIVCAAKNFDSFTFDLLDLDLI